MIVTRQSRFIVLTMTMAALFVLNACNRKKAPESSAAGHIDAVLGTPTVKRVGATKRLAAGDEVISGDLLATDADSKIRVRFLDETLLAVGPKSNITLQKLELGEGRRGRMQVHFGRFWMQVTAWSGKAESHWEVETPNATAGVRGTTLWGDTDVDAICSLDGTVEVKSARAASLPPVTLTAGNCAAELSQGKLSPLAPTSAQVQGFLDQVLIR